MISTSHGLMSRTLSERSAERGSGTDTVAPSQKHNFTYVFQYSLHCWKRVCDANVFCCFKVFFYHNMKKSFSGNTGDNLTHIYTPHPPFFFTVHRHIMTFNRRPYSDFKNGRHVSRSFEGVARSRNVPLLPSCASSSLQADGFRLGRSASSHSAALGGDYGTHIAGTLRHDRDRHGTFQPSQGPANPRYASCTQLDPSTHTHTLKTYKRGNPVTSRELV